MNISSGDFVFSHSKSKAMSAYILRWLLRQMRLLAKKNNPIKKREVYFLPHNGKYILLELVEEEILSIDFVKRINYNPWIVHSIYSEDGELLTTTFHCLYDDFFMETYRQAEQFFHTFKDSFPQTSEMFVLEQELYYSKKIVNKITKKKPLKD